MSTPNTPAWRMADTLAGGNLADVILAERAAGSGWDSLARELYAAHRVVVTGVTLAAWHDQLVSSGDGSPQESPSPAGASLDDPSEVAR